MYDSWGKVISKNGLHMLYKLWNMICLLYVKACENSETTTYSQYVYADLLSKQKIQFWPKYFWLLKCCKIYSQRNVA